ncbi:hypothetical protein Gotri_002884 [Gossypium trilobum]|uniref:Thioredoxin-like protein YLS8 n=1 Tax=Gossypium trilobum TaxID=34281 RepID=A0A7J9F9R6_9ROSI|nr:hypothetical protein [Gossypium trilobum]
MIWIWRRSSVALHVANASSINTKPLTFQSVSCSKLGFDITNFDRGKAFHHQRKKGNFSLQGNDRTMSYLLPHLHSGWAVDQAILAEEERLVVIRFGHDWDETCMQLKELLKGGETRARVLLYELDELVSREMVFVLLIFEHVAFGVLMDEVLASVAETIKNFAVIYLVDITEVPDFNTMYELYDPSTVMFFFRNKHIMIDLGTGNNNKINWALKDKQEFIDIIETVYRGARKGRGLVIAPKDYSTKYRY